MNWWGRGWGWGRIGNGDGDEDGDRRYGLLIRYGTVAGDEVGLWDAVKETRYLAAGISIDYSQFVHL